MTDSVFQLNCQCNNYPWGKKGQESLAARLCAKTPGNGFEIENDKNYSEMWMGDYPTLPAKSLSTGEELHTIIDQDKEKLLGRNCMEKFGGELPFLPKVSHVSIPIRNIFQSQLTRYIWTVDPLNSKSTSSPNPS
jgi:mannose-6-phosphate isomerase